MKRLAQAEVKQVVCELVAVLFDLGVAVDDDGNPVCWCNDLGAGPECEDKECATARKAWEAGTAYLREEP